MWKLRCCRCNDAMPYSHQDETAVSSVTRARLGNITTGYIGAREAAICVSCADELGPDGITATLMAASVAASLRE